MIFRYRVKTNYPEFTYLWSLFPFLKNTVIQLTDALPLTCSRAGTCCHGNRVRLNPWELVCLARAKKMSPAEFRDKYTLASGSVLNFNGKPNHTGKPSCSLYEEGKGCSVHPARPLACRLFPLGRQIQSGTVQYIHEGSQFPCLKECPEVLQLPLLTVEDYLTGQETQVFEQGQDFYMEIMQNLADSSFELLLDTGLSDSGDTQTLASWKKLGNMDIQTLIAQIPAEWLDVLMIPGLEGQSDVMTFAQAHNEFLQIKIQELAGTLSNLDEIRETAELTMALALCLAHAIGADAKGLSEHWIWIAKSHGAR